jgi:hypothetical protein
MRSADKAFVEFVRETIQQHGLSLRLSKTKWVKVDGFSCFGFLNGKEICIATKNPRWIEVLAHEYSHFLQWRKGTLLYRKCFGPTHNYADVVEDWIKGRRIDRRRVRRAFETYRSMERECEQIAVKVLHKHGIDFDMERYAQEANCCIYMYHFMEQRRGKDFQKDPFTWRVLRKMPSSLRVQSHRKMPKEVSDILEDYFSIDD